MMLIGVRPERIKKVRFFKRDDLTFDTVCAEIIYVIDGVGAEVVIDEDDADWPEWLAVFERLNGFDRNWREKVILPAFELRDYIAFYRE